MPTMNLSFWQWYHVLRAHGNWTVLESVWYALYLKGLVR